MIRAALLALALALSGCAQSQDYYGLSVGAKIAEGAILCSLPKTPRFAQSYVLTNTKQACRDFGGKPAM